MLLREYPSKLVTEAIEMAMQYNLYGYDGVFNIIGQLMIIASPKIIPLSKEKLQGIPDVRVNPPSLDKYKALMAGGLSGCR
jgi:hypothetical protein